MATYCAIGTTVAIATGAFVLSFAALEDLAVQAGQPEELAWIWPVIVDGAILQATISIVALAQRTGAQSARRFFWTVLTIAATVSVAGNALHAAVSTVRTLAPLIGAAVATVAPVSLLAATHGLALLVGTPTSAPEGKSLRAAEAETGDTPDSSPETSPALVETETATAPPAANGALTLAVTLKDAGWSNRRIGLHLGVHHKTVGRMLAKAAISTDTELGTTQHPDLPTGDLTTTEGNTHAQYQ
ncbi:DUF2637 domain-containing protein [Nocardia sp. 348MFTsu5.1]|uniref:DUF2637 domain-containing protein n=1 Tax=Nocardia sp. 348MFTsu5.1 TaxID=1172185 RepID=UPI0003A52321|nr:DUF2637 domain-containing protein [Nocardia sp. 348MFTsu5.1]